MIAPAIALVVLSPFLMRISLHYDPQHGRQWIKEISHRLAQEENERRFLTRADFEFEREYRLYVRATLNREGTSCFVALSLPLLRSVAAAAAAAAGATAWLA